MKIKLRTWLLICLFGISSIFSIAIFFLVEQSLENNLLERTKDRLNSINILKKRLVEQVLSDRRTEILRILEYQVSRNSTTEDLIDAVSSIQDVQMIGLKSCAPCDLEFEAKTIDDSTFYRFEYGLDTVSIRVYLDYYSLGDILKERTGLGTTGESYLVGSNFKMISESIFFPDSLPQLIPCKTLGAVRAFNGETGIEVYPDYRGVPIIGVYRLVEFFGMQMAILTEIDLAEAMAPIKDIRSDMAVLLMVILLLSLMGSAVLAEWLVKPVRRLSAMADKLTLGILPEPDKTNEFILEFSEIMESMDRLISALRLTVSFANSIGKGHMNEMYEMLSDEDELGKAIMSMRDQLIVLDQQKIELERQSKKFLIEGQENERERIARDLHDGLGAMLTAMKLRLAQEKDDTSKEEFANLLDDAIKEARNLSRNLMPSVLMDFGLYDALAQLAESTEKNSGKIIRYTCDHDEVKTKLDKSKQVYVYRIVQEAVNNAIKHADCTRIDLSMTEFDDQMNLFIRDNGRGIDEHQLKESTGLGFRNIQERTELLHGEFSFESNRHGTTLEINIPLE